MTLADMKDNQETERPADPLDASRENVARLVEDNIEKIKAKANKKEARAIGECLNPECGKEFKASETERRWCNDRCRDRWQYILDRRNANYKGKR